MDGRLYGNPLEIDFDRYPVHNIFGIGPHKCVANLLVRGNPWVPGEVAEGDPRFPPRPRPVGA